MQNDTELIRLIEQAAAMAEVQSPISMPEVEKLQKIFEQIAQSAVVKDGCTNQLLQQIGGTSCEAAHLLQKILKEQVEDTDKSIQAVNQTVSVLQDLINQTAQKAPVADSQSNHKDSSVNFEPDIQEGVVISQEDVPLLLDFIAESAEHLESAEAALLGLETKPNDNELLNQIFRAFHSIKGLAGFLNLTDIGSLAHAAENLLDLARKERLVLTGENTDVIFESIDMMKGMISVLKSSVEAGQAVPSEENLPQLLAKLKTRAEGQLALEKDTAQKPQNQTGAEYNKNTQSYSSKERPSGSDRGAIVNEEKVKINTSRLDYLINMVGELAIAQLMVAEEVNTNLPSEHNLACKVTQEGKIVRELHELSLSMRMVTIQGVFRKTARLVRDLSHKAGKNIDFVTLGEETELDRSIIDKIADPLVHMIRNSIDHGIESPEERKTMGKNPKGRIELRAFHQTGNIIIEIEDDGRGLSKDRILKKAIEGGIAKADQELSDHEIFELIFHAGLSTAQKVTDVSGRGVGMDIVKRNIESLRGKISINSIGGKGTTFTIRLPLTLAIIDGLVVKVGNERYIIPINSILGIVKPTLKQFTSVQNRGEMVMIRGRLIHMVRLYKLFGLIPKTEEPTGSLLVLVEEGSKKCCLLIDELLGHQQIVIKSFDKALGTVKGISGGAIMGDGKVSLVLDIPGLIELVQK